MPLIFPVVCICTALNLFDRLVAHFGSRTYIGDQLTPKGAEEHLGLFFERFEKLKDDVADYMGCCEKPGAVKNGTGDAKVVDEEDARVAQTDGVDSQLISE